MNRKFFVIIILLGSALFISSACRLATALLPSPNPVVETATPVGAATMDGKALLEQRCGVCHPVSYVYNSRGTPQQWKDLVSMMIANGAELSPQEEQVLDDYLAKNYGQ